MVKCMKILGNSTRGLNPQQKCLLYRSYALPITLYSLQLWFYSKSSLSYPLKLLEKLQRQAALQIVGVFRTALSFGIKAITSLILVYLHLQKLSRRSQFRAHTLPINHILRFLIENNPEILTHPHSLLLNSLTRHQCRFIKGHLVDMDNKFNEVFPSFDFLNPEFKLDNRIIDSFTNHFLFHLFSKSNDYLFKNHIQQLNNLAIESSNTLSNVLIVTDASVKNNVTLSIVHIYVHNRPVIKTLHHAVNITSTEAEFFIIRYGINQVAYLQDISKIIVVTDSIHAAKKIFNLFSNMLQKQAALILNDLRKFFNCHYENIIEFWEYPSKSNWKLHKIINIKTNPFNLTFFSLNNNSWDFSKKSECNDIINKQKIMFQALDLKGRNFMDLADSNNNVLEPIYSKSSTQLQYFGYSNTLYARTTRAITNYASIGKYQL